MAGRVLFVLNPLSGGGAAADCWPAIEAICRRRRVDFELLQGQGDLAGLLQRRLDAGTVARVAGIGGDGTHSALINGLLAYQSRNPGKTIPPYALIPSGTGNDIAKSFGLEPGQGCLPEAVGVALDGAVVPMDLGLFAGRYFADAFSLGLDAAILRRREAGRRAVLDAPFLRRTIRGYPLYLLSFMRTLPAFRKLRGEIEVDGRLFFKGSFVSLLINNTKIYGGVFDPTPLARVDDGLLDLLVVKSLPGYLTKYGFGLRCSPDWLRELGNSFSAADVVMAQGEGFQVRLERSSHAQVDGELCVGRARCFDVSCVKGAVGVVRPRDGERK